MNCPYCNADSRVVDSRPTADGIRRRRECLQCKRRFTTQEKTIAIEVKVIKSAGRPPEEFQAPKLHRLLKRISRGRHIPMPEIMRIVRDVEAAILDSRKPSLRSIEIVHLLLPRLAELDEIVYNRLAINYNLAVQAGPPPGSSTAQEQLALFRISPEGDS